MLQTEKMLIEAAEPMMTPVVYADTREGSGKAKFFLADYADGSVSATTHELPRSLFNGCRDSGTLYQNAEHPLKVGEHQAWNVKTEMKDGGEE